MSTQLLKINILDNNINIDAKVINNDNLIKLHKILNELNLSFTVDNLSQVVKLLFILYLEDIEINNNLKLTDKINFNNMIETQDFNIIIQSIQKIFLQINQENIIFDNLIKTYDKLNYNDEILNEVINIGVKLYQNLKLELQHEINILSIFELVIAHKVEYLKQITVGNLKTTTLYDLYYETI